MTTAALFRTLAVLLVVAGCAIGCGARQAGFADVNAALARGDARSAAGAYQAMIDQAPESMQAALARDGLVALVGAPVLPTPAVPCSAAADQAYQAAEEAFGAGRARDAMAHYGRAVELCPDQAVYWISAGDAYFQLGEHARAKALFEQGLQRDPWQRSGHRFLSDAEAKLGDPAAAYAQAVLAVVSDPTYQAGWKWLEGITVKLGGQWRRAFVVKPSARIGDTGKPVLTISSDPGSETSQQGVSTLWVAYGLLRTNELVPARAETAATAPWPPVGWMDLSPFERERERVLRLLATRQELIAKSPEADSPFWRQMAAARDAGFLEEAIYMQLLDAELAPEYVAFRAKHADRLVRYVREQVAPLPARPTSPLPRPVPLASLSFPQLEKASASQGDQCWGALMLAAG